MKKNFKQFLIFLIFLPGIKYGSPDYFFHSLHFGRKYQMSVRKKIDEFS